MLEVVRIRSSHWGIQAKGSSAAADGEVHVVPAFQGMLHVAGV